MALTKQNLDKYFEKSERENLLRGRIKTWVALLSREFADATSEEFRSLNLAQKQVRFINRERDVPTLPVWGAKLIFLPCIDTDNKPTCPACFKFFLYLGDKTYNLATDQFPGRFVEPIYELLPQFPRVMECAYEGVANKIESEILGYLQW